LGVRRNVAMEKESWQKLLRKAMQGCRDNDDDDDDMVRYLRVPQRVANFLSS
jgi:hypothetical protein